eukprot:1691916-Pyramimonas_sp.AAC.2
MATNNNMSSTCTYAWESILALRTHSRPARPFRFRSFSICPIHIELQPNIIRGRYTVITMHSIWFFPCAIWADQFPSTLSSGRCT